MTPSRVTCVIAMIFLIGLLHFSQARRSRKWPRASRVCARDNRAVFLLPSYSLYIVLLLNFYLKLARLPACSLLPSSLCLLCRASRALHSPSFSLPTSL